MSVNRRDFIVGGVGAVAGAAGARMFLGPSTTEGSEGVPKPSGGTQPLARTLTLDFSGLYAFVFNRTPLALDVLLVDSDQTSFKVPAHRARVRTDPAHVHSSNPTPKTGDEKVTVFRTVPFWDLKGHRVTIQAAGAPPLTKISGLRDPNNPAPENKRPGPNLALQKDVSWLPAMERIVGPGKASINPACLAPNPSAAKIASRLHLTVGEASARFRPPFQDVVWQVAQPGASPVVEQAFGELRLTLPVTTDVVTLNLEPFDGGATKQVVLHAKPTGDTLVEIVNEPAPDKCTGNAHVRKLDHFQVFYELLDPANAATTGPVPVCPDATCPISCNPADTENVYCPGTEFPPGP